MANQTEDTKLTHSALNTHAAATRNIFLPVSVLFGDMSFDEIVAAVGGHRTGVESDQTNYVEVALPAGYNVVPSGISPFQRRLVNEDGLHVAKIFDTPASEGCRGSILFIPESDRAAESVPVEPAPAEHSNAAPKLVSTFYLPTSVFNGTFADVEAALGVRRTGKTQEFSNYVEVTGETQYQFVASDVSPYQLRLATADGVHVAKIFIKPASASSNGDMELIKH